MLRGRPFNSPLLRLSVVPTRSGASRFCCVVGKSVDRRATRRNRIKRMIYNTIQKLLPAGGESADVVLRPKKSMLSLPPEEAEAAVREILRRVGVTGGHT
ncbi:ribonuclease P protein component [Patescibacteria group bacterium]|nr:ribonuclease P protein component [Patescibacteria group bacterium]